MAHIQASLACSRVELRIRCKNLIDKDVMSKSDPCCVVFLQEKGRWLEVSHAYFAWEMSMQRFWFGCRIKIIILEFLSTVVVYIVRFLVKLLSEVLVLKFTIYNFVSAI